MKLLQDKYEHNNYSTILVSRCLTERCQECTGLYVPSIDLMHAQIICFCACHEKEGSARQIGQIRTSPSSFENHPNGDPYDDYQ